MPTEVDQVSRADGVEATAGAFREGAQARRHGHLGALYHAQQGDLLAAGLDQRLPPPVRARIERAFDEAKVGRRESLIEEALGISSRF